MDRTFLVHGYNHDPFNPNHSASRASGQYPIWLRQLQDHNPVPFEWYSGRSLHFFKAWVNGHYNPYRWAYSDLAPQAARDLIARSAKHPTATRGVVCHSLGTRTVLLALREYPKVFSRVVLLNGAQALDEARDIIEACPDVEFLNIACGADDILDKMGAWFAPGLGRDNMLGRNRIDRSNCKTIILDDPEDKAYWWDRNVVVKGDNPKSWGDHAYSFLWGPNWDVYRLFLSDGLAAL